MATLALTWVFVNGLDLAITWLAITEGAREANVLMNPFGTNSLLALTLWKCGGVIASLLLIDHLAGKGHLNPRRVLKWASLGMLSLCVWNLLVLFGMLD